MNPSLVKPSLISIKAVDLEYDLHFDQTRTLKEFVLNTLSRRTYVEKKKDKLLALNGVNLEIQEGEQLGIIGLNGAGKSTLLKVIAGILKPTRGQIKVQGAIQPLIELGAGFDPEFSGRENIYFNSYMLGFTKHQVSERIEGIIEFSELGEFIDVPVKYYSSGMYVRLAFTIATSIKPEILVLDEMLAAGDLSFVEKAKKRMHDLIKTSRGLVLVSHDLSLIESISTRVILMAKGEIIYSGTPASAIAEYKRLAGVTPTPTA